jgi:Glycosyltransferase family 9 (heptosyltransferase)
MSRAGREWLAAERPVAIFSNGYGDHLLNLPALRALSALFPGRLTLICQSGVRESFFFGLDLRSVCEVDMEIVERGKVFDAEAVAAAVAPCDLFLSLNPWHSPSIDRLLELFGRPPSIGFHPPFDVVLERDFSKHSSELAFDVPRQLDPALRLDDFGAPPAWPERFQREAESLLAELPPGTRLLAVHTDTEERKMWPSERFVELLDRLLDRHPELAVLDVGEKDLGLSRGRHGGRVRSCCGAPLPVAIMLVARSSYFFGVDSCFLHAADLWRVPGVGLFGPTEPHEWGFRFGPGRHVCGGGSMAAIEVDEALGTLESLIAEARR